MDVILDNRKVRAGIAWLLPELFFGIVMTMIFVIGVKTRLVQFVSKEDFIVAVVCMNVTWGCIDAVIVFMVTELARVNLANNMARVKSMPEDEAVEYLMSTLDESAANELDQEDQEEICRKIYRCKVRPRDKNGPEHKLWVMERVRLALICMIIASCTCLPIVIPVILMSNYHLALNIGVIIMTVTLLLVGYVLGKNVGRDGYKIGLMLAIIVLLLSVIATFTGG